MSFIESVCVLLFKEWRKETPFRNVLYVPFVGGWKINTSEWKTSISG